MEFKRDTLLTIMINGWDNYNIRSKDVKYPRWFSCSNNILEDPDFEDFSNSELNVWLFLLCLGSKRASPVFTVGYKLATRMRRRFRIKDFISAVQKLHTLKIIEVEYQKAATIRPAHGHEMASTLHNRTEHNNTGEVGGGNHVRDFENSFNQQSLDQIGILLTEGYKDNVPPDIWRLRTKILTVYKTVENFRTNFLDILNSKNANPETNEAGWRNLVSVVLKKQLGVIQDAAS